MHDENENMTFRKNITEHDAALTRILFVNPNGLNLCTYVHRLVELLDNSKPNSITILLLAEMNTHWKNKRSNDLLVKL